MSPKRESPSRACIWITSRSVSAYRSPGEATICPTSRVQGASEMSATARVSLVSMVSSGIAMKMPLSW